MGILFVSFRLLAPKDCNLYDVAIIWLWTCLLRFIQERVLGIKLYIVFIKNKSAAIVREYQTCLLWCDYSISHPGSHIFCFSSSVSLGLDKNNLSPRGLSYPCLIFTSVITLCVKDTIDRGLQTYKSICRGVWQPDTLIGLDMHK